MHEWMAPLVAAAASALTARVVANYAIRRNPRALIRQNVDGRSVATVLGFGVAAGGTVAVVVYELWERLFWPVGDCPVGIDSTGQGMLVCIDLYPPPWYLVWVTLVPIIGMFAAGLWDDLRGDERPRGFGGHLGALRGGAVTGGLVKMAAGLVVSLVTVGIYFNWFVSLDLLFAAAIIALAANLLNLLDRAPGRTIKAFLFFSVVTIVVSPPSVHYLAGSVGAAVALFGPDLRARGMLGDSGANPLGAVMGFGFVVLIVHRLGLGGSGTLALVALTVALLALNLLSERVSFSKVIETTPWLARLDHLGRD